MDEGPGLPEEASEERRTGSKVLSSADGPNSSSVGADEVQGKSESLPDAMDMVRGSDFDGGGGVQEGISGGYLQSRQSQHREPSHLSEALRQQEFLRYQHQQYHQPPMASRGQQRSLSSERLVVLERRQMQQQQFALSQQLHQSQPLVAKVSPMQHTAASPPPLHSPDQKNPSNGDSPDEESASKDKSKLSQADLRRRQINLASELYRKQKEKREKEEEERVREQEKKAREQERHRHEMLMARKNRMKKKQQQNSEEENIRKLELERQKGQEMFQAPPQQQQPPLPPPPPPPPPHHHHHHHHHHQGVGGLAPSYAQTVSNQLAPTQSSLLPSVASDSHSSFSNPVVPVQVSHQQMVMPSTSTQQVQYLPHHQLSSPRPQGSLLVSTQQTEGKFSISLE